MREILITGGAGFVGSNLAIGIKRIRPELKIIALDNLKRKGSELNVPRLKAENIIFMRGDVSNMEDVKKAGVVSAIIECSAEASVLAGLSCEPDLAIKTNLLGLTNCLELLRESKGNIIFLSTSRVYPYELLRKISYQETETRLVLAQEQQILGVSGLGVAESFPLNGVRSLYGTTKLCAEMILQEYINLYSIKGIINRCSVIAGPWQMGKVDQGFIAYWLACHMFKMPLHYIGYGGTGKQVRDVLHVDDLRKLILFQLENMDRLNGRIFNVGGGIENSVSLIELTSICQELTGQKIEIGKEHEERYADVPIFISDSKAAHSTCAWKASKNVYSIVEDTYRWILDNKGILNPIFSNQ